MPGMLSANRQRAAQASPARPEQALSIGTGLAACQRRTMRCAIKIKGWRFLAITVLVVLTAAFPPAASGHNGTVASQHSLNFVPLVSSGFSGQVTSEAVDCVSG